MADTQKVAAEFVDAFNAHDETRIHALNAENAVFEGPGDLRFEGRGPVTEYAMAWLNAFPDARVSVHNELVAADWVVQEFSFQGTHQGTLPTPAGDIQATNREINGRGVQILHVDGNTIVDTRLYYDQVQLMMQLGLMPEVGARA